MTIIPDRRAPHGYLVAVCFATTLGGFLFGYDTAVISGCIDQIAAQYALGPERTGWVVASAVLGAIIGSAASGVVADRFGRRRALVLSAYLLLISVVGSVLPQDVTQLVIARMIGGVGVGITAVVSPMYMSEIAPARYRGGIVALYQLALTLGILCAFAINAWLLHYSQSQDFAAGGGFWHWIMVREAWRGMFGGEMLPAVAYLALLWLVPESPRWLMNRGRPEQARAVMVRMMRPQEADRSLRDLQATLSHQSNSVLELLQPGLRVPLVLGVCLALLGQFSGINAVMYFGPTILQNAGFGAGGAYGGAILVGLVNFVFTGIAIWKVDSFGRRPLLLLGVGGAAASLVACAVAFRFPDTPAMLKLVPLLMFCACFSFSYGPVVWIVLGEIFPTRVRGRAVAIATTAMWVGAFIVSQLTPRLLESVSTSGTFALFAIITLGALVFIWKMLPETKGRTLEEIEQGWLSRSKDAVEAGSAGFIRPRG